MEIENINMLFEILEVVEIPRLDHELDTVSEAQPLLRHRIAYLYFQFLYVKSGGNSAFGEINHLPAEVAKPLH